MGSKITLKNGQDQEFSINHKDNVGAISIDSDQIVTKSGSVTDNSIVRFDGTTGKVQNSNVIIDDAGNLGNGTQTFNGFGGSGFKNYIINGAFNIDQYNRGARSNWNSADCYTDRFLVASSSSVLRNGAGVNIPVGTGLYNHLSVTKAAGADTQIIQRWEIPKDKAKQFLNGRTLTFSCWVLAGTTNFVEHLIFIKNGISANSYEVKAFNITKNTVAHMWTRVTGTITNIQWTYEAGDYIEIRLDPVCGLAGELHTTGWQLEEGSVATPFEHRPYGLELSLCQRYYESSYSNGVAVGSASTLGAKYSITIFSSTAQGFTFIEPKRVPPTVAIYSPSGTAEYVWNSSDIDNGNATPSNIGTKGVRFLNNALNNWAANSGVTYHYTASAEL